MVLVKFNKEYKDVEIGLVKANTPVEMTLKRADEAVKNIRAQSDKFEGYDDFNYERVEEKNEDKKK